MFENSNKTLLKEPLRAPHSGQTLRLQIFRRSHADPRTGAARRHCRAERLRKIERHRCGALGSGRIARFRAARRLDAGRHLQRRRQPQAAGARQRRAAFRQFPGAGGRAVVAVRRAFGAPRAAARRRILVLHQRHARAAARRHRRVPGHGPRAARLRHHRTGHDFTRHRGQAGRIAGVPGGGGRHLPLQGPPARNREPARRHSREPRARQRYPHRTGRADRKAGKPGEGCLALQGTAAGPAAQAAPAVVPAAQGRRRRPRKARPRHRRGRRRGGSRHGTPARSGEPRRDRAPGALRYRRFAELGAGSGVLGERGGGAPRIGTPARGREPRPAGKHAHRTRGAAFVLARAALAAHAGAAYVGRAFGRRQASCRGRAGRPGRAERAPARGGTDVPCIAGSAERIPQQAAAGGKPAAARTAERRAPGRQPAVLRPAARAASCNRSPSRMRPA